MPGKRELPSNRTLHAVDVIIVSVILLISHVHVHEARPPSEHNIVNTRLQEARGLYNTQRLGANSNNHRGASHTSPTHDSTNRDADRSSMFLPSGKDENVDRANTDDGSIFTMEGSGDSSVEDHESNDDNEEGDEEDYDVDERGEDIDPGSGNHEPKDILQSSSSNTFSKNSQTTPIPAGDLLSSVGIMTKPTLTSTSSNANEPSTNKHEYDLPTTIKPASSYSSKVIPPSTFSSIFTSTTEPQHFLNGKTEITTRRPWSLEESTKLPDSSKSRSTTNPTYESEEEDEEDEDNDDDEDSQDFEDNLNSESESRADKPVIHVSTSTTETHPTLQTIYTQQPTTTFKPSTITVVPVETTTPIQPISTTVTTTTTTARPFDTDKMFTPTITTAPIDEEPAFVDTVDDDDDDDDDLDDEDLDDEDDDDDLDDTDSDISNLDPKYSKNTVDTKNVTSYTNSLEDITTTTPTDLKLDPTNNRDPPVITDSRMDRTDEPRAVYETYYPNLVSRPKIFELRSLPLFAHPVIILLVLGSTVTGLYVAILIVMFIVYRLRRQEEI